MALAMGKWGCLLAVAVHVMVRGKEAMFTHRSEPWWNDTCSETLLQYQDDKTPENWSTFRKATRAAKHKFFDAKIEEIAKTNQHPWDLMEWVKGRKLPPCEAIQYNKVFTFPHGFQVESIGTPVDSSGLRLLI